MTREDHLPQAHQRSCLTVAILFGCCLLTGGAPAAAQETPPPAPSPERTAGEFELRRGLKEWGISGGYAFKVPLSVYERRTNARFATVIPSYGRFQTTRRELVFEAPLTIFTTPEPAVAFGPSAVMRQHFARRGPVIPFAEAGVGFVLTNVSIPELGGPFQFSLQAGAGLRVPLRADSSLIFGARWYHLSNAGYRSPNSSLNNIMITAGFVRSF
jgi:hypothetical protein